MSDELETTQSQEVEGNVYVLDDGNNKHIAMTKEETEAKIAEALTTGTITDDFNAFIEMIKEQNKGSSMKFWLGTKAEYLALESTDANTVYFLTDNTSLKDLDNALTELISELQNGSFTVYKAHNAVIATSAMSALVANSANDAVAVNGLEIEQDDNGVLKIGDTIIPQKKLVWEGETTASISTVTVSNAGDYVGKKLSLVYSMTGVDDDDDGNATIETTFICNTKDKYYEIMAKPVIRSKTGGGEIYVIKTVSVSISDTQISFSFTTRSIEGNIQSDTYKGKVYALYEIID